MESVSLKGVPPIPTVKMKRVKVDAKESKDKLEFFNGDGRFVLEITIPPAVHADYVDVAIGPDAKLDEIANVIACLWGNTLVLNHKLTKGY